MESVHFCQTSAPPIRWVVSENGELRIEADPGGGGGREGVALPRGPPNPASAPVPGCLSGLTATPSRTPAVRTVPMQVASPIPRALQLPSTCFSRGDPAALGNLRSSSGLAETEMHPQPPLPLPSALAVAVAHSERGSLPYQALQGKGQPEVGETTLVQIKEEGIKKESGELECALQREEHPELELGSVKEEDEGEGQLFSDSLPVPKKEEEGFRPIQDPACITAVGGAVEQVFPTQTSAQPEIRHVPPQATIPDAGPRFPLVIHYVRILNKRPVSSSQDSVQPGPRPAGHSSASRQSAFRSREACNPNPVNFPCLPGADLSQGSSKQPLPESSQTRGEISCPSPGDLLAPRTGSVSDKQRGDPETDACFEEPDGSCMETPQLGWAPGVGVTVTLLSSKGVPGQKNSPTAPVSHPSNASRVLKLAKSSLNCDAECAASVNGIERICRSQLDYRFSSSAPATEVWGFLGASSGDDGNPQGESTGVSPSRRNNGKGSGHEVGSELEECSNSNSNPDDGGPNTGEREGPNLPKSESRNDHLRGRNDPLSKALLPSGAAAPLQSAPNNRREERVPSGWVDKMAKKQGPDVALTSERGNSGIIHSEQMAPIKRETQGPDSNSHWIPDTPEAARLKLDNKMEDEVSQGETGGVDHRVTPKTEDVSFSREVKEGCQAAQEMDRGALLPVESGETREPPMKKEDEVDQDVGENPSAIVAQAKHSETGTPITNAAATAPKTSTPGLPLACPLCNEGLCGDAELPRHQRNCRRQQLRGETLRARPAVTRRAAHAKTKQEPTTPTASPPLGRPASRARGPCSRAPAALKKPRHRPGEGRGSEREQGGGAAGAEAVGRRGDEERPGEEERKDGGAEAGKQGLALHCCPQCPKTLHDFRLFQRHLMVHGDLAAASGVEESAEGTWKRPYRRADCPTTFLHAASLDRHALLRAGKQPFACEACGRHFRKAAHLRLHQKSHPGGAETAGGEGGGRLGAGPAFPHCCDQCGKVFRRARHLYRHMKIHTGHKPCVCSECGKRFRDSERLRRHERVHTGETPYPCPDCGKRFRFSGDVRKHQRIHTGALPYQCPQCSRRFRDSSTLKKHQLTHSGRAPFQCPDCGRRFSQVGNLKRHRRTHSGEAPYRCPDCGKGFNHADNLKRHGRVHTPDSLHPCPDCGTKFRSLSKVRAHRKSHAQPKSLDCPHCGKTFRRSGDLRKHQLVHSGERPFACTACPKRFGHLGNLKKHLLIHTGALPFRCPDCHRGFNQLGNMKKHRRTHQRGAARVGVGKEEARAAEAGAGPEEEARAAETGAGPVEEARAAEAGEGPEEEARAAEAGAGLKEAGPKEAGTGLEEAGPAEAGAGAE
ncbi:uncharacterized protein [Lepisosteus oculatus]